MQGTTSGGVKQYIHSLNFFTFQVEEKALCDIPPNTTLKELIALISSAEEVATEELFFVEGHPLNPNEVTLKGEYVI